MIGFALGATRSSTRRAGPGLSAENAGAGGGAALWIHSSAAGVVGAPRRASAHRTQAEPRERLAGSSGPEQLTAAVQQEVQGVFDKEVLGSAADCRWAVPVAYHRDWDG